MAAKQHRHERVDLGEAGPAVGGPGGRVEVVDVQRHDRGDAALSLGHHGGHARGGQSLAAPLRVDPDALHLAGVRGGRADLGLEDDLTVLDPGERPPGPDQLGHPGPVGRAAVGADRRDTDLLGEHGHAGGHQHVELVRADPPDQPVGRDGGRAGQRQHRLDRADVSRRPPAGLQQPPQLGHGGLRAHQRGAAAALGPGAVGERRDRLGRGRHRDQVGPGVAQRGQPAAGVVTPHLRAQTGRVEPGRVHPGADEHVGDRLGVTDPEHLVAIAIIEYAQRPGPRRFHAEHSTSVAELPGRLS